MSQWVSESVTDKHCQWSDSGPIKKQCYVFHVHHPLFLLVINASTLLWQTGYNFRCYKVSLRQSCQLWCCCSMGFSKSVCIQQSLAILRMRLVQVFTRLLINFTGPHCTHCVDQWIRSDWCSPPRIAAPQTGAHSQCRQTEQLKLENWLSAAKTT